MPRVSHCKSCESCIYKMDHHCVWTQNCIGYRNQKSFYLFCVYMLIGDLIFWFFTLKTYATLSDSDNFFDFFPTIVYIWWGFTCFSAFSIGIMLFGLAFSQMMFILVNYTTLDFIKTKKRFTMPLCC